jgi:chromosome segregation ATPase
LKQQIDKYEEDIQKVKEELQALYDKKNTVREHYFKEKLEFELEKAEIYHAEWIAKEKNRLIEREQAKLRRIEERKQALLDRPNPYEKEIETCDHLIAYMNKLKVLTGLVQPEADE